MYRVEIANRKYEAMLRTELLGEEFAIEDLQTFSEDSPRTPRKLFTYGQSRSKNSEDIPVQVDSPYKAKYSTSPIGAVGQRILQSPQKLPRQISRTPVKVLDAPDLQVRILLLIFLLHYFSTAKLSLYVLCFIG
jgi:cell division cycle 20-like protein 1 (cofactor of APC complex)